MFLFIHQTKAQCSSRIGELKVFNFQHEDGIFVCYNDTLKVAIEDYELMDSQKLYYVYHSNVDVLNSTIIDVDTMQMGGLVNRFTSTTQLYITALVAKEGFINFGIIDSCAVFSKTVMVNFLSGIAFNYNVKCDAQHAYCINLQIKGGLPTFNSSYGYIVNGEMEGTLSIDEIGKFKLSPGYPGLINLYLSDENGCTDTLSHFLYSCHLPIELLTFKGTIVNEDHLLKWATASQIEIDYFLLEVSKNGNTFEVLDTIDGAGTTSETMSYKLIHENLSPGIYQYKLSKISSNGFKWELATVELIAFAPNVFPNPTKRHLNFHLDEPQFMTLNLQIFDLSGKRVLAFNEAQLQKNALGFSVDVSVLSGGIYFAQIKADKLERVEKFVVEK